MDKVMSYQKYIRAYTNEIYIFIYLAYIYIDHPPTRSPMSSQAAPRPYFQASCLALWDGPGARCLGMTSEQNTLIIFDQIQ